MTKHSISTIALLCALSVPCTAADYKGSTPKDGATYRLYNVGTGQFLSSADGVLTLGGGNLAVTLTKTADGYYTLSTADGNIGTTLWGAPRNDGSGKYQQWTFRKVKGSDNVYTLANRYREASATFSIYQDDATGALAMEAAHTGAGFSLAQWKLVGNDTPEVTIVTIDEAAESFTVPTETNVTVKLKRTLTAGTWSTFCVPFNISREQMEAKFGTGTQLAALSGTSTETIDFTTTKSGIVAGIPYIIRPESVAADATYEFEGVSTFVSSPRDLTSNNITFHGSFTKGTAPAHVFVMTNGTLEKLDGETSINGLQGYFADNNVESTIWTWSIDGTTGINAINGGEGSVHDIYNTAGQKVKANATGKEHLQKGIYIIKGKKLTK